MQRLPPPATSLGGRPGCRLGDVGVSASRAGRGRGSGGCWEGRRAAGQAGKSHTRSGSGDAPAAPLLLLDLAADSGPRICIFWQPVEKERRTEPAAFKGTAQAVASPREAVWGAGNISQRLRPLAVDLALGARRGADFPVLVPLRRLRSRVHPQVAGSSRVPASPEAL